MTESAAVADPQSIPVLDKGFVRLVDALGGDADVVSAARVSYGQGSKGEEKDRKLISFLLRHEHMTPFEHVVLKFHVSCPIFVMRQWIRHRSSSYNEISARYTEVRDEFYAPRPWRAPDPKNKQGSQPAPAVDQDRCSRLLAESHDRAYAAYKELLAAGAARELARMVLPVSLYTQFYWTINARNLMHFIGLRADAAAQWEIQQYALALAAHFEKRMPWTWEAYLLHGWRGANRVLDRRKEALAARAAA